MRSRSEETPAGPRTDGPATLLVSSWAMPAARPLADVARRRGWSAAAMDERPPVKGDRSRIVFYGSTLEAAGAARRYDLALLEPPLDLLARLPAELLLRRVEFSRWGDLGRLPRPLFLKPADALDKVFDAGVYHELAQVRTPAPVPPGTAVLVSDPVEWLAEYRCFVLEGRVAAFSPYLSFGRPLRHAAGAAPAAPPAPAADLCRRLAAAAELPPAYVVDVGLVEDRGWAVVEFNPVWCAGTLSADPAGVLDVLERACRPRRGLSPPDRRWVVDRPPPQDRPPGKARNRAGG